MINYVMYWVKSTENDFDSPITWPDGFISLCKSERIGEITPDLQAMKAEAGDDSKSYLPAAGCGKPV